MTFYKLSRKRRFLRFNNANVCVNETFQASLSNGFHLIPPSMNKSLLPAGRLLLPVVACCLPFAAVVAAPASTAAFLLATTVSRPAATVTGRVINAKGEGLPGVTVLVKGTQSGTTTDAKGNFAVEASDGATLVFSSVGFRSQEITANSQPLTIKLLDDEQRLNEVVVVVGYLTQKREDVTGSVASVSAAEAKRAPVATLGEGIQGRLPGVTVATSGAPG